MLEDGQLIGRFYLDMHPRPNKYNHAAQFAIRTGVAGRQIPEAALICNLPGRRAGRSGPDDARRRGDVLPRVRPSGARAVRRAGTSGSASAASAPSRTSSRRRRRCSRSGRGIPTTLADVREALPDQRADSGGAGDADAPRERVRQGARACASRWCTRSCRCRSTTAIPRRSTRPRWSRS